MAAKFIVNHTNNSLNKRVLEIKLELNTIEIKTKQLQYELETLQKSCSHNFIESSFVKTCSKCQYSESVYY
jgi:hypothetical protein